MHAHTKHIKIDFHIVCDLVAQQELDMHFVSTEEQVTDSFTKGFPSTRFAFLRHKLLVLPRPLFERDRSNIMCIDQFVLCLYSYCILDVFLYVLVQYMCFNTTFIVSWLEFFLVSSYRVNLCITLNTTPIYQS